MCIEVSLLFETVQYCVFSRAVQGKHDAGQKVTQCRLCNDNARVCLTTHVCDAEGSVLPKVVMVTTIKT